MRPKLIGLTGTSGAGKDTVAGILADQYGYRVERMMAPLRPVARAMNILPEWADWESWKKIRPDFNEQLYRLGKVLQEQFSTDDTDAMILAIERRMGARYFPESYDYLDIRGHHYTGPPTVIVDTRQEVYRRWVKFRGGAVVWVDRDPKLGRAIDKDLDGHRAEVDAILPNHRGIPELIEHVRLLLTAWES